MLTKSSMPQPLTDDSVMQWGNEHKGKRLDDVPDRYLLWAYNTWTRTTYLEPFFLYVEENLDAIQSNIRNNVKYKPKK
jgi:hypothetical protein